MLTTESTLEEVYKAPSIERSRWATLMSKHYSTEEEKFTPKFFLDYVDKNGKLACEIGGMLEKPLNKFFKKLEENDLLDLEGECEDSDKGTPEINEHFYRLSICDPHAILEEEKFLNDFAKQDFSYIDKELKRMGIL